MKTKIEELQGELENSMRECSGLTQELEDLKKIHEACVKERNELRAKLSAKKLQSTSLRLEVDQLLAELAATKEVVVNRLKDLGVRIREGRYYIYSPNHPHPNALGKYVLRYRLVVDKNLGRFLHPSEQVHHINGNPTDDRIENLQVMSRSEHARLHCELRNAAKRLPASKQKGQ